ncbi:uncharacterized protein MYCFIDRAFT_179567 [Pseudocercospora fijiensis CIRAD86]|uniref:Uncharacterized protein n=1 Tax=Pseudocercospora fijiensis (strain CIRAD86) TaxID=383855 RepID=M3AKY5_PSEFD|nr:uncharacterized protein MYCFIDRAFT_179567 [Pseudocercospora fijiensis CIRAD86]EME78122.1 hypothetical protein MYCFIDRAFT_179567 [Pseudocercospora fijiensis CIRAD86]
MIFGITQGNQFVFGTYCGVSIYEESIGVFYGLNTFVFECQQELVDTALRMKSNFERLRLVYITLRIEDMKYGEYKDYVRQSLRQLMHLPQLRLDKLMISYEYFEDVPAMDCYKCDKTGVHDRYYEEVEDLLKPILSMAKRAKSVEVGYTETCTSLKRFILSRVAHRPTVKMLATSSNFSEGWLQPESERTLRCRIGKKETQKDFPGVSRHMDFNSGDIRLNAFQWVRNNFARTRHQTTFKMKLRSPKMSELQRYSSSLTTSTSSSPIWREEHLNGDRQPHIATSIDHSTVLAIFIVNQTLPSNGLSSTHLSRIHEITRAMSRTITLDMRLKTELAQSELRAEITDLVEPYRMASDRPPFSACELMIMACASQDFSGQSIPSLSPLNRNPFEDTHLAFSSYDLPIEWSDDGDVFKVCPKAARVALRHYLEPTRAGMFLFIKLPPELRNRIYQLSLVFDTELDIASSRPLAVMRQLGDTREPILFHVALQRSTASNDWGRPCYVLPEVSTTALLRVSRQVRREASKIFYGLNTFKFENAMVISNFFDSIPLQVVNIRRLSVVIDLRVTKDDPLRLATALEKLSKSRLDLLTLCEQVCPIYTRADFTTTAIDAMLACARHAKQVKYTRNYTSRECTSLERFVLSRLRPEGKVKLLCYGHHSGSSTRCTNPPCSWSSAQRVIDSGPVSNIARRARIFLLKEAFLYRIIEISAPFLLAADSPRPDHMSLEGKTLALLFSSERLEIDFKMEVARCSIKTQRCTRILTSFSRSFSKAPNSSSTPFDSGILAYATFKSVSGIKVQYIPSAIALITSSNSSLESTLLPAYAKCLRLVIFGLDHNFDRGVHTSMHPSTLEHSMRTNTFQPHHFEHIEPQEPTPPKHKSAQHLLLFPFVQISFLDSMPTNSRRHQPKSTDSGKICLLHLWHIKHKYLQGNENLLHNHYYPVRTHSLVDTNSKQVPSSNFSLMAERARHAAQSIIIKMAEKTEDLQYEEQAVLQMYDNGPGVG